MAERVFKILTKLSKNLTDRADKKLRRHGSRKEFIRPHAFVFRQMSRLVSLWIEKTEIRKKPKRVITAQVML